MLIRGEKRAGYGGEATLQQLLAQLPSRLPGPPAAGWLRLVRESVGMTLETFGARLGVTRSTAQQLEQAEVDESITIKRLRAGAAALNCDLVVLVVPRQPIASMVREQALVVARQRVERTNHSMALENQALSEAKAERLVEEIADDLVRRRDKSIWAVGGDVAVPGVGVGVGVGVGAGLGHVGLSSIADTDKAESSHLDKSVNSSKSVKPTKSC